MIYIIILIYIIYHFYITNIDYWGQIYYNSLIPDYTRWLLSDKYIAKEYAKLYGFKVPKTYQLTNNLNKIKLKDNCVIKPVDLCDSAGVYLIKNNYDIRNNRLADINIITKELDILRRNVGSEYYMYDKMYDGLSPYNGYIVEELLLDDNGSPANDYKCYVFGGKLYYIALTHCREINNGVQTFKSCWYDRDFNPITYHMINKNYDYKNIDKPNGFDKLVSLVENISNILKRHCRVDCYLINGEVYLGEFTFFCGAFLHSYYANFLLGKAWLEHPDDYYHFDNNIIKCIPSNYNNII